MTRTLGVCVVGAGFWADTMHLPSFGAIDGVEVVSVVAASEQSAKAAAAKHGVDGWSTDAMAAISDPRVDIVDIVAPNDLHAPVTIAAAEAGKHVFCIKPLARTLAEADDMIAAVESAGTRLFYSENVPFIPAVQEARRTVEAGEIGEVFRVKACEGIGHPHSAWFMDRERSGGGVMIDMAVHSVEFCRTFAQAAVRSVYAECDTFLWSDETSAEDTSVMTLRFDNGVIGQCEDSWSLIGAMDSRFEVFGTEGRILIDNLHRQPIQVVSGKDTGEPRWSFPLPIPGSYADGHVAMLQHFVDCLRSDSESLCEPHIGWAALAVVEAAAASTESGQRTTVPTRSGEGKTHE